jgi:hypothetical protein
MAEAGDPGLVTSAVDDVVAALVAAGGTLAGGTKSSAAASAGSHDADPGYPRYLDRRAQSRKNAGE